MWREDKPPIMGLLEQGGKAALKVAKHVSEKTVDGLMKLLDQGLVIDTGICKKAPVYVATAILLTYALLKPT